MTRVTSFTCYVPYICIVILTVSTFTDSVAPLELPRTLAYLSKLKLSLD